MYKILAYLLIFVGVTSLEGYENAFEIDAQASYQWNTLKWNLEEGQHRFNSFDRMEWKNVQSVEVGGLACMRPFYDYYGYKWLSYLAVEVEAATLIGFSSGDFKGLFRENPSDIFFTNQNGNKGKIHGTDFSVSLGYDFFITPTVVLIPVVGYASEKRELRSHPGPFISNIPDVDVQTLLVRGLHDHIHWHGPWVGLYTEMSFGCDCEWKLSGGGEYHFAVFRNKALWKADEIFDDGFSFFNEGRIRQKGTFRGVKAKLSLQYNFYDCWTLSIGGFYEKFNKRRGEAHVRNVQVITNPSGQVIGQSTAETREKFQVWWQSYGVTTSLNYIF